MIEIIYNEEEKEGERKELHFHLPKNIRQIGESDKGKKIYIEDYAVTYINQYSAANQANPCIAILLGRVNWLEGTEYIFISGILDVEDMEVSSERISFTDNIWTDIHTKSKQFFPSQEIVGWFLSVPGATLEITDTIYRAHLNYFPGNDKIFLMRESIEKDEAFFIYENNQLKMQAGYYIYYEKNVSMQEYMVYKNQGKTVESQEVISDRAIQSFRRILEEKKEMPPPPKMTAFMYSASIFLVMTVLVIGITMINSHDKMKNMEDTLNHISKNLNLEEVISQGVIENTEGSIETGIDETQKNDGIEVETVMGQVSTLDEQSGENAVETAAAPETEAPQATNYFSETSGSNTLNSNNAGAAGEKVEEGITQADVVQEDVQSKTESQTYPTSINEAYTIQAGDTLLEISKNFYGTSSRTADICTANNITDMDKIYPGQIILLP